jgi:hypothetical protein
VGTPGEHLGRLGVPLDHPPRALRHDDGAGHLAPVPLDPLVNVSRRSSATSRRSRTRCADTPPTLVSWRPLGDPAADGEMSPGRWFVTLRVEATADPPTIEDIPITAGSPATSVVADDGWVCGVPMTSGLRHGTNRSPPLRSSGHNCAMA